jgi:predicted nuclease of restriction endonuclease-like (RecB) superfamily
MITHIKVLITAIQKANSFFLSQIQKQVNTSFTLRNWLIGFYLAEYEQNGKDRADYGEQFYKKLSESLKNKGVKGLSFSSLHLFKQLYHAYPEFSKAIPDTIQLTDLQFTKIVQTASGQLSPSCQSSIPQNPVSLLLSRLSFSHFVALVKVESALKRTFYESECIRNNWSVRELQRAIAGMLFERTGISIDKDAVLAKSSRGSGMRPEDIFRNPYLLDFLGLPEKLEYVENDLEQAIIDNLQTFLLEMGRGFCFEARQKRITFDNTHYRIDLVFYHRILKCHVLIDLKMEHFSAADAGQMNVYLNYYKENELCEGDNLPVGIILCSDKNETLVKYATTGLTHHVFVSKYMTNLPSEKELAAIINLR